MRQPKVPKHMLEKLFRGTIRTLPGESQITEGDILAPLSVSLHRAGARKGPPPAPEQAVAPETRKHCVQRPYLTILFRKYPATPTRAKNTPTAVMGSGAARYPL